MLRIPGLSGRSDASALLRQLRARTTPSLPLINRPLVSYTFYV